MIDKTQPYNRHEGGGNMIVTDERYFSTSPVAAEYIVVCVKQVLLMIGCLLGGIYFFTRRHFTAVNFPRAQIVPPVKKSPVLAGNGVTEFAFLLVVHSDFRSE